MPPKKKVVATTYILKFKSNKITYILPIEESELTLSNLKFKLLAAINESGGLQNDDDEQEQGHESSGMPKSEFEEENIVVPKSEFEDPELELDDVDDMKIEDNSIIKSKIKINDLKLAIPRDIIQPYNNEWIEIKNDDQLSEVNFKDYLIFAFTTEDKFNIIEAAYDE
ncbi:unnamed protein product [Candida verbasci]|uniref:Uncharacterized protein n=1 Tax=Candida verbasci TaxID=1227364 RepID=A0A9W4U0N7_9ASCO|nr:unnamed protein product [Candida verbasci]